MKQTTLRLPEKVDVQIKKLAEKEERSYNKQVIHMLKTFIRIEKERTMINEIRTVAR